MVWYLPTAWFEDLGRAKRVSFYTLNSITNSDVLQLSMECDIDIDGKKITECVSGDFKNYWMPTPFPFLESPLYYQYGRQLIKKLRSQIREKYPKHTA